MNSKTIITFSFLIIALSLAYYFVIFLPSQERNEQQLGESKTQVYENCAQEANDNAKSTMQKKIEILEEGKQKTLMQEAYDKGMYLKEDYNSYYERCLKRNGISE